MRDRAQKGATLSWWLFFGGFLLFLLVPGPLRSVFSGVPLSSKALALFAVVLVFALLTALYRPSSVLPKWMFAALAVLCFARILLVPLHLSSGWKGVYESSADWKVETSRLSQGTFLGRLGGEVPHRIDPRLQFNRNTFNLTFLNDLWPEGAEYLPEKRDFHFPLNVHWTGYTVGTGATELEITAAGAVRVLLDGRPVYSGSNPAAAKVVLDLEGSEWKTVEVFYSKPGSTAPSLHIAGFTADVYPSRYGTDALSRSRMAAYATSALGAIGLLLLFFAFTRAYPRLSVFFLEEIWDDPLKIAAVAFFACFVIAGVLATVPMRQSTILMNLGDDYLAYEGQSRAIVKRGPLMLNADGSGNPFYWYPLYPYTLAAAHLVLGEDFANVIFFNFLCVAAVGPLVWSMVRRRLSAFTGVVLFVAVAAFAALHLVRYVWLAYSDNLYVPIVLAVVAASIAALERRSLGMLFLTGVLAALGAATRPSLLLYVPWMGAALLILDRFGTFSRRVVAAATFGFGFAAGVAPFTIRNWLVSRKFVLLVSSFIMLPYFLYPPEVTPPSFQVNGAPPGLLTSIGQFFDVWAKDPTGTLWVEIRKVLFTFGVTSVGPQGLDLPSHLVVFPLLFGLALGLNRIPRQVRNAMLIFAGSHLTALVMGAPWTYGYKTILPLHLVFLVGAAFLVPRWGEIPQRELQPEPVDPHRKKPLISVILPTYNEKDSIRQVILDFFATGVPDEVIVINNNAAPGTSEEVAGTGAIEIHERRQGYGAAIKRGLREAKGDWIVICEPDGTFLARDIHKLMAFADDFDVVYGSRTAQQFIWRGANMGMFLRWGNWAVAKYLQFLFNATNLTDVGCTMRLVRRDVALSLLDKFRIDGNQFGPEMMVLTLRGGYRVIQVPVNYLPRVGESSVTGDPLKAFRLGLEMIWLITSRRFQHLRKPDCEERTPDTFPFPHGRRSDDYSR